jgi:uncharacterized protein YkwD
MVRPAAIPSGGRRRDGRAWRRGAAALLAAVLVASQEGCTPRSASPANGCAGAPPPADGSGFEAEVVRLVNAERSRAGLAPLQSSEPLSQAARFFAHDMAREDYFVSHDSHDRVGGRLVRRCGFRTRVRSYGVSWRAVAENIASGHETPEEVVAAWMRSPRHRANVLGSTYRETGVGFARGGSEGFYWVQDFGRRR